MVRKLVYLLFILLIMTASAQAVITHQYTFNKLNGASTGAEDMVGTADGTLMGGATVSGGQLHTTANGDYLDLPAAQIAINTYSAVTLELWEIRPAINQSYSMTAAFGNTDTESWGYGYAYLALSTTRGDNVTRSMMTTGEDRPGYEVEVGENGPELNDGLMHYYVLTVGPLDCCFDSDVITLYIDGQLQGAHIIGQNRSLADIGTEWAYLMKGTYGGDGTVIGDIEEYTIWDEAIGCDTVLERFNEGPQGIPEPATMVLLGLGSLALLRRRK